MGKNPIKQIYLLLIVIVGIISLSVYSTYALFTYEKETNDIVKISTLASLSIDEDVLEYRRVLIKHNSLVTVDVFVNNSLEDNMCYGVWYDILSNSGDMYVYKASVNSMTSGNIDGFGNMRVPIIIVNTSSSDNYMNIGINSSYGEECYLNLDNNKHLITEVYNPVYLNDYILENIDKKEIIKDSEYKEIKDYLIELSMDKLMVSTSFKFNDGVFELIEPYEININDIDSKKIYYFILDNNNHEMYKIDSMNDEYINTTRYIGFVESINGIVEYDKNYQYYGANPDNYLCFNDGVNECDLYRIVGLFYDKDNDKYNLKIVRNDYLGREKYSLIDNNLISNEVNSNIYNVLMEYYNNLSEVSKKNIIEYGYNVNYNGEFDNKLIDIYNYNSMDNYRLKVGLLSIVDYLYASNCNDKKLIEYDNDCYINNYLYKYDKEMSINRLDASLDKIYVLSDNIYPDIYDMELNIRPVMYLDSNIIIVKGDGSINNPFIIR